MPTFRERLKSRFAVLGLTFLVVLGVLLARLWTMQVLAGESYAAMADDNRLREIPISAPRGRILDRKGRELVVNRSSLAVVAQPTVKDDPELVGSLARVLKVRAADVLERLASKREGPLEPRTIALDVPTATVAYLEEHESLFPGVDVQSVPVRLYPNGMLAAHVLGYTGEISEGEMESARISGYRLGDIVGKTGAEKEFETVLQGDKGFRRLEVDAAGRQRDVLQDVEPVSGRDVQLTIDRDVQKVAERALAEALDEARSQDFRKAHAAAAVALDVRTGEVLALASLPTYDPGLFLGGISKKDWKRLNSKESDYPLNDRTLMSAYPPGSTFKVVTGLAGLRYGITSENSPYDCPGKWTGMGEQWPKWCWKRSGHGDIHFHYGVVDSCDTVFYEIGYEFYQRRREELQKVARSFGLGSKTGIDLPGEVRGRVPDAAWKKAYNKDYPEYAGWLPGDTVNMAIGQGDMLVTPLQLASVYAAIANDGKVPKPHVLKAVLDDEGRPVLEAKAKTIRDTKLAADDLEVMKRALLAVTEEGTAEGAFAGFPMKVAGKTGTSQVAGKDDYALFACFAPAEEPRYAVAVIVEQGGHGGSVAAPAARTILAKLFGLPIERVHATDASR